MTDDARVCPKCGCEMGLNHDRIDGATEEWERVVTCPGCGHEEKVE